MSLSFISLNIYEAPRDAILNLLIFFMISTGSRPVSAVDPARSRVNFFLEGQGTALYPLTLREMSCTALVLDRDA